MAVERDQNPEVNQQVWTLDALREKLKEERCVFQKPGEDEGFKLIISTRYAEHFRNGNDNLSVSEVKAYLENEQARWPSDESKAKIKVAKEKFDVVLDGLEIETKVALLLSGSLKPTDVLFLLIFKNIAKHNSPVEPNHFKTAAELVKTYLDLQAAQKKQEQEKKEPEPNRLQKLLKGIGNAFATYAQPTIDRFMGWMKSFGKEARNARAKETEAKQVEAENNQAFSAAAESVLKAASFELNLSGDYVAEQVKRFSESLDGVELAGRQKVIADFVAGIEPTKLAGLFLALKNTSGDPSQLREQVRKRISNELAQTVELKYMKKSKAVGDSDGYHTEETTQSMTLAELIFAYDQSGPVAEKKKGWGEAIAEKGSKAKELLSRVGRAFQERVTGSLREVAFRSPARRKELKRLLGSELWTQTQFDDHMKKWEWERVVADALKNNSDKGVSNNPVKVAKEAFLEKRGAGVTLSTSDVVGLYLMLPDSGNMGFLKRALGEIISEKQLPGLDKQMTVKLRQEDPDAWFFDKEVEQQMTLSEVVLLYSQEKEKENPAKRYLDSKRKYLKQEEAIIWAELGVEGGEEFNQFETPYEKAALKKEMANDLDTFVQLLDDTAKVNFIKEKNWTRNFFLQLMMRNIIGESRDMIKAWNFMRKQETYQKHEGRLSWMKNGASAVGEALDARRDHLDAQMERVVRFKQDTSRVEDFSTGVPIALWRGAFDFLQRTLPFVRVAIDENGRPNAAGDSEASSKERARLAFWSESSVRFNPAQTAVSILTTEVALAWGLAPKDMKKLALVGYVDVPIKAFRAIYEAKYGRLPTEAELTQMVQEKIGNRNFVTRATSALIPWLSWGVTGAAEQFTQSARTLGMLSFADSLAYSISGSHVSESVVRALRSTANTAQGLNASAVQSPNEMYGKLNDAVERMTGHDLVPGGNSSGPGALSDIADRLSGNNGALSEAADGVNQKVVENTLSSGAIDAVDTGTGVDAGNALTRGSDQTTMDRARDWFEQNSEGTGTMNRPQELFSNQSDQYKGSFDWGDIKDLVSTMQDKALAEQEPEKVATLMQSIWQDVHNQTAWEYYDQMFPGDTGTVNVFKNIAVAYEGNGYILGTNGFVNTESSAQFFNKDAAQKILAVLNDPQYKDAPWMRNLQMSTTATSSDVNTLLGIAFGQN